MSDPTLYRIDRWGYWEGKPLRDLIERMIGAAVLVPVEPVYKPTPCTSKWGHRIGKDNACKAKGCGAVWTERWLVKIGDTDE